MKREPKSLKCEDVLANVKRALVAQRVAAIGLPIPLQSYPYIDLGPFGVRAVSIDFPGVTSDG